MLRVIGKLIYVESRPYDFTSAAGEHVQGTSVVARVDTGRGKFEDVKCSAATMAALPADGDIPEGGVPVDLVVELRNNKVVLVGLHAEKALSAVPNHGEGTRRTA